jgi:hypothetical protein
VSVAATGKCPLAVTDFAGGQTVTDPDDATVDEPGAAKRELGFISPELSDRRFLVTPAIAGRAV